MRDAAIGSAPVLLTLASLSLASAGASALQALATPATAEATEPYRVGGDVTRPEKISGAAPVYTEMARKARVMGVVILEAIIDEQGDVTHLSVLKGLPMGLDRAAVEAVETWKFKPATLHGQPVEVYYVLTVNFQVQESPTLDPALREFLDHNPQFMADLRGRRYGNAREAIEPWAAERPTAFALAALPPFVLAVEGRLEEAWSAASAHHGPERYDVLTGLGALVWRWAAADNNPLSAERRAALYDLGLEATSEAMAERPEDALEAIEYKSLLLRYKARLSRDPDARRELEAQASQLEKSIQELRARRQAAAGAADLD